MASRGCINSPDLFCYVCGYLTDKSHRKTFTPFLKRAYELYFDSKVDSGRSWAPQYICLRCACNLRGWLRKAKKNNHLAFGVPMIWLEQCKHMWRKLRNCYLNAINRRQTNKSIPKWKYETEMSFLLPFVEMKAIQPDLECISDSPNLGNVSTSYNDNNEMVYDHESSRCESPEMILPETSGMIVQHKRGYWEDMTDGPNEMISPPRRKLNQQRFDETEMFFLSISETVKRLRPVDQARVKKELCNMVYEAEIRQLEEEMQMEEHG